MKWEYKCLTLPPAGTIPEDAIEDLNKLGADGWELVQLIPKERDGEGRNIAFLKRSISN